MTMPFKERLKDFLSSDFFLPVIFVIAYLCTNSYIYGWDDQHLEIPLLKHLIDPTLYRGDYYVESLAKNFSSYMYPLLARCITVDQVPTAYFILFLTARYLVFFWLYKLWLFLSKDRFSAICAIFMFMLLGRTEEFLYRTFSHQTAGECLMFAGIYFFYKERFFLAALIFGLAANIHGIYNLFPMIFMLVFLLIFHSRRWSMVFKTGLTFTIACLPFLIWQIPKSIHEKLSGTPVPLSEWMPLYYRSCPQNFLFFDTPWKDALANKAFLIDRLEPFAFLIVLYVFLLIVYPPFRKDQKTHVIIWTASALMVFSTLFTYWHPSRFVLDLNLLRNEQFIRLILMAYTTFWAVKAVKEAKPWQALLAAFAFLFIGFDNALLFQIKFQRNIWVMVAMIAVFIVIALKFLPKFESHLRKMLIVIPLLGAFISWCMFHYQYAQVRDHGPGFWQMQRNWVDIQKHTRQLTPKDALILAPINMDMGGFRIHSERKVLVCIRDCGIIGFDYPATVEWSKRMDDMKDFIILTQKSVDQSVLKAILKYKVDYIVFMKYYEPRDGNPVFEKMYENEVFGLFKVKIHPKMDI